MRIRLYILVAFFIAVTAPHALRSQPRLQWQFVDDNKTSSISSIVQGGEDGWMFCGTTQDTATTPFHWGGVYGFVANGKLIWEKHLGIHALCFDIIRTKNGYVIAGVADSAVFAGAHGATGTDDAFLCKIDEQGNLVWGHQYGGSQHDMIHEVIEASNGDLVFGGTSQSNDGDLRHNAGEYDAWVGRVKADGSLIWDSTYGGERTEGYPDIVELRDHTFELAASTNSNKLGFDEDMYLMHLDSSGKLLSQTVLGSMNNDGSLALHAAADGNIILAANWASTRAWLSKLTPDGHIVWQTDTNGLPFVFAATSALFTPDDGVYFIGWDSLYFSTQDTVTNWILRLDSSGREQWHARYAWTDATSQLPMTEPWIAQMALDRDGGLVLGGEGDVHGISHGLIVKLSSTANAVQVQDSIHSGTTAAIITNGTFTIDLVNSKSGDARLVNVAGLVVRQTKIGEGIQHLIIQHLIMDTARLPAGFYLLEVTSGNERTTRAVIVR